VGHGFEPRKTEKARGALDRMDVPENVRQQLMVIRGLLQFNKSAVQTIEVFRALYQKFFDNVIHDFNIGVLNFFFIGKMCPMALIGTCSIGK
jgi:hypothetical protein